MSTPPKVHTTRKYTRRTAIQWRELITGYEQSHLSLEAYCHQHQIAPSSFYTWRKRFQEETPAHASEGRLIEITPHLQAHTPSAAQPQPSSLHIELDLGHGCVLRIRGM
jgi:transposase-like protein